MTALLSTAPHSVDFTLMDDQMELASSPVQQEADLDLGFDAMDNLEQQKDDMMGEAIDLAYDQCESEDDIDLLDDETLGQDDTLDRAKEQQQEIDMQEPIQQQQDTQHYEDEILFDEDDDAAQINTHDKAQDFDHTNFQDDDLVDEQVSEIHETNQQTFGPQEPQTEGMALQLDENIDDGSTLPNENQETEHESSEQTLDPAATELGPDPDLLDVENAHSRAQKYEELEEAIVDSGPSRTDEQALGDTTYFDSEAQQDVQPAAMETKLDESVGSPEHAVQQSHLHPVRVVYLGQEMALFAPSDNREAPAYFLQDSDVAHEPIEKLLQACREVLHDTIGHDDELVLDVPTLGLHICEDSKYASQITLAQVLEVFLTLNHNEKIQDVEPFYCNLSTRVCLGTQYAYLSSSAREGKMFSEIVAEHVDTPVEQLEEPDEFNADVGADSQQNGTEGVEEEQSADLAVEIPSAEGVSEPDDAEEEAVPPGEASFYDEADLIDASQPDSAHELHEDLTREGQVHDPTLAGDDAVEAQQYLEDFGQEALRDSQNGGTVFEADHQGTLSTSHTRDDVVDVDESTSSHTVGPDTGNAGTVETGEFDEFEQFYEDDAEPQPEDSSKDEIEADTAAGDLADDANNVEPQIESYSDEELFAKDEDDLDDELDLDAFPDTDAVRTETAPKADDTEAEPLILNGKNDAKGEAASITTPVKTRSAKRKAVEDEDEIDLLLNDTPEPKRRKPTP